MTSHSSGQVWVGVGGLETDDAHSDRQGASWPGRVRRTTVFLGLLLLALALVALALLVRSTQASSALARQDPLTAVSL
jgi:hypothetical protein